MSSGIKASDDALKAAEALFSKSAYHFLVFHISKKDGAEHDSIEIESSLEGKEEFDHDEQFAKVVSSIKEPRFTLVKVAYKTKDGRDTDKVVFCHYNPDNSSIKTKMLYASTAEDFKAVCPSNKKVQASDAGELTHAAFVAALQ